MGEKLEYLPLQQTMPLMNPQYPPQYEEKFTEMKKHIELGKFDSRANELAEWLIPFGETNYNCWFVKKMCYLGGVVSFEQEMQFSENTLYEKVKNFQLWEHRRFLLQHHGDRQQFQREYELVDSVLEIEPKNYHAWSHRVWLLGQVKNFQHQLNLTQQLILADPFNNSVWAYRTHVVHKIIQTYKQTSPQSQQSSNILEFQITQCLKLLQTNLNNEAAWNYLRGYFPSIQLKSLPSSNPFIPKPISNQNLQTTLMNFLKTNIENLNQTFADQSSPPKPHHFQSQIQLLITLATLQSHHQSTVEFAKNTCLLLAQKQPQKKHYWKWVAANLHL